MITRRTLLTGTTGTAAAALASPATAGEPGASAPPTPAPAPRHRTKLRRTGVTRANFTLYTGLDDAWEDRYLRGLDVLILPRAEWDARSREMLGHGWKGRFIDDGRRVLAIKLRRPRWYRDRRGTGQEPSAESLAILRRLRGAVVRALEAEPDVTNLSLSDGGDGEVVLRVDIDGIEPTGHILMEFTDHDIY